VFGVAGLILLVTVGCHSDGLAGAGGATGAGTGGFIATGGTSGTAGLVSTGGQGGLAMTGGVPSEWGDAGVEAGVDCMTDHNVCGSDAFCGIVQIDGVYREHSCLSKGNCQTCQCLAETLAGFYDLTWNGTAMGSSDLAAYCCAVHDAAASSIIVVECNYG
jgi:hypothetical protein